MSLYAIYTDGSKNSNAACVGAAAICPDLDIYRTKAIHKGASIFTAECIALSDALDIALQNQDRNFIIFSDSQSAL